MELSSSRPCVWVSASANQQWALSYEELTIFLKKSSSPLQDVRGHSDPSLITHQWPTASPLCCFECFQRPCQLLSFSLLFVSLLRCLADERIQQIPPLSVASSRGSNCKIRMPCVVTVHVQLPSRYRFLMAACPLPSVTFAQYSPRLLIRALYIHAYTHIHIYTYIHI